MDYTILAFIALLFYGMTFSLIVMILDQYKKARRLARYEIYLELERIETDELNRLDNLIRFNVLNNQSGKSKLLLSDLYTVSNFAYLRNWLSEHLTKYPDGLPRLSGTIIFSSEHSKHTLNFYDATDQRIEKYLKTCMRLFKEPKPKRINILKQATKIVRTRKSKVLAEA